VTYQKLPFHLQAKGEFEYVGRKVVGNGCSESAYLSGASNALNEYCLGVPNKEFRLALARPFDNGKLLVGVNMMIASGWTGQTYLSLRGSGDAIAAAGKADGDAFAPELLHALHCYRAKGHCFRRSERSRNAATPAPANSSPRPTRASLSASTRAKPASVRITGSG
jgi:hypothetical protein